MSARLNARRAFYRLAQLLGGAVVGQALLSAANLAAGVLLLRYAHAEQYGGYVLVGSAVALLGALQAAFVGPPLVQRLAELPAAARRALAAGAWREQRRLILQVLLIGAPLLALAALATRASPGLAALSAAALLASAAALYRNFHRLLLQFHRRAWPILCGDMLYAAVLVLGILLSCRLPGAALMATLALGAAALLSGSYGARALRRDAAGDDASRGVLRQLAPLGLWSAGGAAIHWTFNQGYNYLVAALADVGTVGAIAGTRLALMPVNLLSTGIGSTLLPLTVDSLQRDGARRTLRRLALMAGLIALLALLYAGALWLLRDWLFDVVLRKSFAQRDTLLLLWMLAVVAAAVREPLIYLVVARQRLRALTLATGGAAIAAVGTVLLATPRYGAPGAVGGVLLGELCSLAAVLFLCWRECRPARVAPLPGMEMTT
ncbi:lipopolysaccharide biosynthesis protein [Solimonas soli]|uniref:lipopolysaccharide biosynthesis protein n=1 Tax=Solimonas soli TaxID=413479 RepID=UPI0004B91B52|nr:hypothetical protein [Solimonas soli]